MKRRWTHPRSAWGRQGSLLVAVAACVVLASISFAASAHPAGFTSVNRYVGVECDAHAGLHIAYLIDFAEMPSYSELDLLDHDHDSAVSPQEQRAYLDRRVPPLVEEWTVEVDGIVAAPRVTGSSLAILEGERGLSTVRIAADVTVALPEALDSDTQEVHVHIRDPVFAARSGWREMAAQDSAGWTVTSGPKEDAASALSYTAGGTPPRIDEAWFTFRRNAVTPVPGTVARPISPTFVDPRLTRLSRRLREASRSGSFSAMSMALALALGAAHALSPGHGKSLAAAYLAGSRAHPLQAFVFGATVTLAHTSVVFAMGCLAIAIEHTMGSDRLMQVLEVAAALTVVALGAFQLSKHWRNVTHSQNDHTHAGVYGRDRGLGSVIALGASAGLTPCPSALALLLTAVALHRFGFGLVLVLAFSAGVACTLTVTGLLVMLARRMLDRLPRAAPLLRWLPVLSSLCVLVIGVVLCASAW